MSIELVKERLAEYQPQDQQDEINALKEIMQELILYALAKKGFFNEAAFHGGTMLRIVHGMRRFSEDLDFALLTPNENFTWKNFSKEIQNELSLYGIEVEEKTKIDKTETAVKKMLLKETSLAKFLELSAGTGFRKKIMIKIEIDTNPPAGAATETKYILFPLAFGLSAHTLESAFGGKSHALLCREYIKGRDWFDFVWYVSKNIKPHLGFLKSALHQQGPWKGKTLNLDMSLYGRLLKEKIKSIDWEEAKKDTSAFLRKNERDSLRVWSEEFFVSPQQSFETCV